MKKNSRIAGIILRTDPQYLRLMSFFEALGIPLEEHQHEKGFPHGYTGAYAPAPILESYDGIGRRHKDALIIEVASLDETLASLEEWRAQNNHTPEKCVASEFLIGNRRSIYVVDPTGRNYLLMETAELRD